MTHRCDCNDGARQVRFEGLNFGSRYGDHLLNGSKTFITCGQQADIVLVVCRTDPDPKAGAKAFSILIVERDMPGFERGRNLDKLGQKAQDTSELFSMT